MKHFQDIANEQGWTLPTQIGMLLQFIEAEKLNKKFEAFVNTQIKDEKEMTEEEQPCDKNGYPIAVGQKVKYFFIEVPKGKNVTEVVAHTGEVMEITADGCLVWDDNTDVEFDDTAPAIPFHSIEVIMDGECQECGHEFSFHDAPTRMVDGVGHNLDEVKVCPNCESQDISNK